MSRPNLGMLFYRSCYEHGDNAEHIANTIDRIVGANGKDEPVVSEHGFQLTTAYPGLLCGTGYAHGIGIEADIKAGFFFDHSSGLPVIPGSSVKGTLRHLFGLAMKKRTQDPYKEEKAQMIAAILNKPELDVETLAKAIFEGVDAEEQPLGPYRRDRFFDARVVKTKGKLLADDYITPHKEALKNPIPIRFLKVAPGVTFQFSFSLVDTHVGKHTVTAEEKELLFSQLLQLSGIGAKTNTGYGAFEPLSPKDLQRQKEEAAQQLRQRQKEKEDAERRQRMSPFEREIEEICTSDPNSKRSTLLLKAIESGRFGDERNNALVKLREFMQNDGEWKEVSNKKNPAKDKDHQRTLKVKKMLEDDAG